jgi:hypothetical protein
MEEIWKGSLMEPRVVSCLLDEENTLGSNEEPFTHDILFLIHLMSIPSGKMKGKKIGPTVRMDMMDEVGSHDHERRK